MNNEKVEILDENNCIHTTFNKDNCDNNPWQQDLFGENDVKQKSLDKKINIILNKDPIEIKIEKSRQKKRTIIGIVGFVIFFSMMIVGISVGDVEGNLLPKAIRFCLECIGIG